MPRRGHLRQSPQKGKGRKRAAPRRRAAPPFASRGLIPSSSLIINETNTSVNNGYPPKDISLNHLRTSLYPALPGVRFQFPSPPRDQSYSNISIFGNRSRNGLVPKDQRYNHIIPIII